jgi:CDP-diacylglycerol--serine O-phosphatidyltransferase
MNLRESAPTLISLANAAAGFMACAFAVMGLPELGALIILAAVLLDSLDGALARSLDVESDLGAELDSLADVVSFGVAPAVLIGSLLAAGVHQVGWMLISPYPLCAAWRLARFNVQRGDAAGSHGTFTGLPSTGAGAAAASAVLIHARLEAAHHLGPLFLPYLLVLLGALMVSRISYRHVGVVVSRLTPLGAALLAALFVTVSLLWDYEYLFCAVTWGYVLSGPLVVATEKIRAVRHA